MGLTSKIGLSLKLMLSLIKVQYHFDPFRSVSVLLKGEVD